MWTNTDSRLLVQSADQVVSEIQQDKPVAILRKSTTTGVIEAIGTSPPNQKGFKGGD